MEVPQSVADRKMLATILLKEDEELTPELLERAVRALQKIHLKREMTRLLAECARTKETMQTIATNYCVNWKESSGP